jgi:radical SAM superfamily enzyme
LDKLKEVIEKSPKPLVVHRFFSDAPEDLKILQALQIK